MKPSFPQKVISKEIILHRVISISIFTHILMYFTFCANSPDEESGFPHRKVTLKRQRDVRAQYEMLDEIGR